MSRKASAISGSLVPWNLQKFFRGRNRVAHRTEFSAPDEPHSEKNSDNHSAESDQPLPAPLAVPPAPDMLRKETPLQDRPETAIHQVMPKPNIRWRGSLTPIAKLMEGVRKSSYRNPMSNSIEIYTQHFELNERPFTLLPDPDFLFWSPAHQRAFTMLEYGTLTGAPITLITGEVGAGKTTLLHHFLKSLDENMKVGLVSNAHGSRGELLRWVLMSLDQPADNTATYVDLFDQFQEYLIEEYASGNRVILIFDEAQNLSQESLEELRMFTNINANKDELLQLVLVGQPELRQIVQRPELRQFAQRVASSFHLNTMDENTTLAYIGHRLKKAGAHRNLFTESASRLVHQNTHGVPRLVNQLCDLSMVYAFAKNQKTVTLLTVEQVLSDGAFFGAPAPEQDDENTQ